MVHGELIGLIEITSKERGYDEKDKELMESLVDYIAPILRVRIQSIRNENERILMEKIRQKNEQRAHALLEIFQKPLSSKEELTGFTMEEAIKLTQSELGFIGYIDEHETTMSMYLWSRKAMQECTVDQRSVQFPLKDGGLWADAVKQHRAIIVNNYSKDDHNTKGYPAGHVLLPDLLAFPYFGTAMR